MKSKLLTILAFAALLLGVTTACNRNSIGGKVVGTVSESPFVYDHHE